MKHYFGQGQGSNTNHLKRDILIQRLRNGIFIKSNTKRFIEFTNCNFSQRLVELTLVFFNDVEEHEFPLNCTKSYLKTCARFSPQSPEFYSCIQLKIGLLILLNCAAASLTVFATTCPKEQQTNDNLTVKDNCFIIEIFDKWDVRFASFPSHFFLVMKSETEFFMSMSDHVKQQVLQEFFAKKVSFSWKTSKLDTFLFYQSGRTSTHIENILPIWSRGSVALCINPLHNVRYRTTERTSPNK